MQRGQRGVQGQRERYSLLFSLLAGQGFSGQQNGRSRLAFYPVVQASDLGEAGFDKQLPPLGPGARARRGEAAENHCARSVPAEVRDLEE
jgi:hypothetical protein